MYRRRVGLLVLLVALLIGMPLGSELTLETWSDGLYDAESDGSLLAVRCPDVVVDVAPAPAARYVSIVLDTACTSVEAPPDAVIVSSPTPRAPPAS